MKTLIIKCSDFRTILLTFIKVKVMTKAEGQPLKTNNVDTRSIESDEDDGEILDTHSRSGKTPLSFGFRLFSHSFLQWRFSSSA